MYINLKRDKILSRISQSLPMARIQVKNRSKTYWTIVDLNQVYPESQEIATFDFHISNWQRSIDPSSSIAKQVVKWERERERDVHEKGLVGEQEVYKSFCRPIRSRKTFRDLRPTNETVPLKFFHACTMRTTPRFIVRDYSRVVKWKWRTIEGRGEGKTITIECGSFFLFFFWSFMISLFLRRYRLFEIFREF